MRRDIAVLLSFVPTDQGGRATPVRSGYRAQFRYDGQDWDAVHEYPNHDKVAPGATVPVFLNFLSPVALLDNLAVGKPFDVREGSRLVARGHVEEIVDLHDSGFRDLLRDSLEAYYLALGSSADVRSSDDALAAHQGYLIEARRLREFLRSDASLADFRTEALRAQAILGAADSTNELGKKFDALVKLANAAMVAG